MLSLFNKLKKDYFGPILTHFLSVWAKEIFLKKTGSLTHNVIWVSNTMPKFK